MLSLEMNYLLSKFSVDPVLKFKFIDQEATFRGGGGRRERARYKKELSTLIQQVVDVVTSLVYSLLHGIWTCVPP